MSVAKNTIWSIVINDLRYVGQYWNQTGYDLWEEVCLRYRRPCNATGMSTQRGGGQNIPEFVPVPENHVHNLANPKAIAPLTIMDFQPCYSKVPATHMVLVDSFRSIYPINRGISNGSAVAVGSRRGRITL